MGDTFTEDLEKLFDGPKPPTPLQLTKLFAEHTRDFDLEDFPLFLRRIADFMESPANAPSYPVEISARSLGELIDQALGETFKAKRTRLKGALGARRPRSLVELVLDEKPPR